MVKNIKLIQQLFAIKRVLNQAGKKKLFWEAGLSVSSYEILRVIADGNDEIFEIRKFFTDSAPALTQKLNVLEKEGLIKKEKDKKDARSFKIILTLKGQKTLERIEKKINLVSSLFFRKYKKEEKEIFMKILEDLEEFLVKRIEGKNR